MGKVKDTATSWPPQALEEYNQNSSSPMEMTPSPWVVHPPVHLAPLSCGGYIYSMPVPAPQPPPVFIPMQQTTHFVPSYVSDEIVSRQEKLEKYRQKRGKRNYNRPVDQARRERACARTRDGKGQFATEIKTRSEQDEKIMALERELDEVKRSKEMMREELEQQQLLNQALMTENTVLWSSVPSDQVFSTIRPQKWSDAFRDKVDFSHIELNWTDSPHLEAARMEEAEVEQRWEEMSFIAGARP